MNHPTKGPLGPDRGKGRGLNRDRCLTEVDLENYLYDRLRSEDLERVEEHLLICTSCQDRLAGEEEYVTAFRTASAEIAAGSRGTAATANSEKPAWSLGDFFGSWNGWAKSAAAAMAVAVLVIAFRVPFQNPSTAMQNVVLSTERGDSNLATANAGFQVTFNMDLKELEQHPSYLVEVVTANEGTRLMQQVVVPKHGQLAWKPLDRPLNPGDYVIRIYANEKNAKESNLLREYVLRVSQSK